jgi:phospholipase A1
MSLYSLKNVLLFTVLTLSSTSFAHANSAETPEKSLSSSTVTVVQHGHKIQDTDKRSIQEEPESDSIQEEPKKPLSSITETLVETYEDILDNPKAPSIFDERELREKRLLDNPFAISQYRQNYLLPLSYVTNPNDISLPTANNKKIDNFEAKYQISLKMPIWVTDKKDSGLFFGFTLMSFWQVYNDELSKPFRETNYEPEVFYQWQTDLSAFDMRFNSIALGINHQSNGQTGIFSRSWNRLTLTTFFSSKNAAYYLRTWYRLAEDEKIDDNDPFGDDNPDILDYVGRLEFGIAVRLGQDFKLLSRLRNNLNMSDNRGSLELNLTYPFAQRYNLMLQYFNGYGDSMIDYNRHQQRIGLGVQLRFL